MKPQITKAQLNALPSSELNRLAADHFGLINEGRSIAELFLLRPGDVCEAYAVNQMSVGHPARPDAPIWNPVADDKQATMLLRWASENHGCLFEAYFSLKKVFKAQGFDGVIQEMRRAKDALNHKIEAYVRLCGEVLSEEGEPEPKEKVDKPQSAPGRAKGGHARAASLTPERRKEIAQKAVTARWAKQRKEELTDDAG